MGDEHDLTDDGHGGDAMTLRGLMRRIEDAMEAARAAGVEDPGSLPVCFLAWRDRSEYRIPTVDFNACEGWVRFFLDQDEDPSTHAHKN